MDALWENKVLSPQEKFDHNLFDYLDLLNFDLYIVNSIST